MTHEQVIELSQLEVYSTQLPLLVSMTLQSKQPIYVWASSLASIAHDVKANIAEHQSKLGVDI